ncbi:hypothetical protein QQS21_001115 [Conoideocrella luteorostrata]|uniref:Uncharacterized protein n=1 Tax=Conoideocrella luteorostrata TaxID=1105319 RepID=A0AAJ0CXN8_9HYPO|nr:hypothetical protein QQS21_001115 [Conoideocrella luteorostrata]
MAVTRRSNSRRRHQPAPRRNPNRASREIVSRSQRHDRLTYAEEPTDVEDFADAQSISTDESNPQGVLEPSPKPILRARKQVEPNIQTTEDTAISADRETVQSKPKRSKSMSGRRFAIGQKRGQAAQSGASKRRKVSTQRIPEHGNNPDAVIPDWRDPRISFECWTDIFLYAAREGSTEVISSSWLVHAATTCKTFAEPALTAMYRCPAIKNTTRARHLTRLLGRPLSETLYNYRAKIDTLYINIHLIHYSALFQLVHPLPRLKELIVYTPLDQPPYRGLDRPLRWHYPQDMFQAFEAAPAGSILANTKPYVTILKSWEWSGRFIGGFIADLNAIACLHQTTTFSQLTRLSLTNFQVPSLKNLRISSEENELRSYHEDGIVIHAVAQAVSQLSALKHLIFESSTVMNDRLLPLLPNNLIHLELINCWEVKSEDFATFLRTHGSNMRTLSLSHNQSLALGFLTDLAETCPKLRELKMNLSYYRHHDCINDADPMYDQVLLPSQLPKWPSSLRVLSIEHIREWTLDTANMFLQSILDSAPRLAELRYLAIKTMLDIPWQARATMRREWRNKMERVFLRPYVPPNPVTTLRPASNNEAPELKGNQSQESAMSPSRRSNKIASSSEMSDFQGSPIRSSRCQHGKKPIYKESDTEDDEFDSEESRYDEGDDSNDQDDITCTPSRNKLKFTPSFIHGKCTTVNIVFDNQKVRELQYTMEDFGSQESDSEEEWDGDHEDDVEIVLL